MAEKSPIEIPKKLPDIFTVLSMFIEMLDDPQKILGGLTLRELLSIGTNKESAWVVGSRAWRPAVLGENYQQDKDVDVVVSSQTEVNVFAGYVKFRLDQIGIVTTLTTNRFGGLKIVDESSKGIMDIWSLPEDTTIAEHIMGFRWDHERVAISASVMRAGEISKITRIVKPQKYDSSWSNVKQSIASSGS